MNLFCNMVSSKAGDFCVVIAVLDKVDKLEFIGTQATESEAHSLRAGIYYMLIITFLPIVCINTIFRNTRGIARNSKVWTIIIKKLSQFLVITRSQQRSW